MLGLLPQSIFVWHGLKHSFGSKRQSCPIELLFVIAFGRKKRARNRLDVEQNGQRLLSLA
jgi:hypothetical protein